VYLAEAHAADTWPLAGKGPIAHQGLQERCTAAMQFLDRFPELAKLVGQNVYTDDMSDEMTREFALWPERYMLLEGGAVRWASSHAYEHRMAMADMAQALDEAASAFWSDH
jgi:hypothetical protein